MDYKIIAFDEAAGQLVLHYQDTNHLVDLPIDENGVVPTGVELDKYLRGFIPTWHYERKARLAKGIVNIEQIRALVQPLPVVEKTREQLEQEVRNYRQDLLDASDWTQYKDSPMTPEGLVAWQEYRQALRDVTKQPGFPYTVDYPAMPLIK